MLLSYATATAALGYTAKLAWDMLRHNGPSALLLRSAVAAAPKLPLPGLQAQVRAAMGDEFASQRVDVSLRQAQVIGNDGRRLVVRAQGIARFDGSDTAPVTVRALYEQGSGRWLDAQYDFDVVGG